MKWIKKRKNINRSPESPDFILVNAILGSGQIRVGSDSREYAVYEGNIRRLQGGPSSSWIDANIHRLLQFGLVERWPSSVRGKRGRPAAQWAVALEPLPKLPTPESGANSSLSAEHPRAGAGQTTTTDLSNNTNTTGTSSKPGRTDEPDEGHASQGTSAATARPAKGELERQLVSILAREGVSSPDVVVQGNNANRIVFALRELADMRNRGESPWKSAAAFLKHVILNGRGCPPTMDLGCLAEWEQREVSPKVLPFRRRA